MSMESLEELRSRLLREERVQQMVRARAYEIFQMRGGQPGWEAHDWFQAEGEVLAFLIAIESRREDELRAAETKSAVPEPEALRLEEVSVIGKAPAAPPKSAKSAPKAPAARKAPVAGKADKAPATKKLSSGSASRTTTAKPAAPRKSDTRPKGKGPRKSSKKEDNDH